MNWASWIWASFIPQIRSSTVWRTIWDKLPTSDTLHRIGYSGPSICYLRYSDMESIDHIFFGCRFTQKLLSFIFDIFDIHLCFDLGFSSLLLQAQQVSRSKQIGNLWRHTFVTTFWTIWHVRNRMVFDDRKPSYHTIIIILGLIREAQSFSLGCSHSIEDIITCRKLRIKAIPRPPKITITVRWKPPPPSVYKVNTDGSMDSDQRAA